MNTTVIVVHGMREIVDRPLLQERMTWKTVQDGYKRLQEQYDSKRHRKCAFIMGWRGEMGELEDVFMTMREERDYYVPEKAAVRNAKRKRDVEKDGIGNDPKERDTRRVWSAEEENGDSVWERRRDRMKEAPHKFSTIGGDRDGSVSAASEGDRAGVSGAGKGEASFRSANR